MELIEFTALLHRLSREKVADRAISLCQRIIKAAKTRGLNMRHISEVHKQLLDSGIVNQDELQMFHTDANRGWANKEDICVHEVGMDDDIEIAGDDIEITAI